MTDIEYIQCNFDFLNQCGLVQKVLEYHEQYPYTYSSTVHGFLNMMFNWSKTSEGQDYWQRLQREIRSITSGDCNIPKDIAVAQFLALNNSENSYEYW